MSSPKTRENASKRTNDDVTKEELDQVGIITLDKY